MKLTDVEFQGDNKKATFFYIADDRVDFRELLEDNKPILFGLSNNLFFKEIILFFVFKTIFSSNSIDFNKVTFSLFNFSSEKYG